MKIKFYLLALSLIGTVSVQGQVGIGNATPNTNTILDLTNTNNRSLLLPVPLVNPSTLTGTSFNTSGMMFYFSDNIYLKTSSSYKVITPWIYDGTAINGISSPASTTVGIGLTATAGTNIRLQITDAASDVVLTSSNNASIAIGSLTGPHMLVDNDEILVKLNANTADTFHIQQEGGIVEVRSTGSDAGVNTVLIAHGSMDAKGKMKENGNDLLPVGSIIMYSGSTAPAGWALCNGGTYALQDGSGNVTVPDLRERFIVGIGDQPLLPNSYAINNTGGLSTVTLSSTEMPVHNHSCSGVGNHTHDINSFATDGLDHDASGGGGEQYWRANSGGPTATQGAGAHTHTIGDAGGSGGITQAHENKPPYYALAFIYKL